MSKSSSPTIVLHSAWDVYNIGDIGHTPGTLRLLEQYCPEARVIVLAMMLNEPVRNMLEARFPRVRFIQGSLEAPEVREALGECDLFIRNSGMGQDTNHFEYMRRRRTPYGIYGQSYFRDMVEGEGAAARVSLLNDAAFLYCRETKTLEILRGAGVTTPVLDFGPDGCFGIDVRNDAAGLATLERLGLEERKFITLQLRTHTPKRPGVDCSRVPKLNPLHPTPENIADDERRAGVYRELITEWVTRTGLKVLLAPEVRKEMEHNKRLIYDRLPPEIQAQVVNLDHFWNADEAAAVFARAHTAICHEPHSLIIALANGTPIIHTFSEFHSPKCWMFADIGLPEWLLEFDSTPVRKIADTLFAIHDDYATARQKVATAMDFVRRKQAEGMAVIRKVIGL